jgi:hypothetical protein
MKINAFIVNRNLLTTLKNTVDFLSKNPNINIVILDQGSTYPPLLDYYKNLNHQIIEFPNNDGPHSVWSNKVKSYHNDNPFILCDSDCTYDGIPADWLDKMMYSLDKTNIRKVGFSIEIDDLPSTPLGLRAKNHEKQFWNNLTNLGYISEIDTTFAIYKKHSSFGYDGIRLPKPYTMRHELWYLDSDNINDEWQYYIKNAKHFSTWGSIIKQSLKEISNE